MEKDYMDSAFGPLVDVLDYKGHTIEVRKAGPDSSYLTISDLQEGALTYHCEEVSAMEFRLDNILERILESISEQHDCEERLKNHG